MCIRVCNSCGGPVDSGADDGLCHECRFINLSNVQSMDTCTEAELLKAILSRLEISEEGTIQTIDDQGWFLGLEPRFENMLRKLIPEKSNDEGEDPS